MKDSESWLSPRQAGLLVGYSARHVQNFIMNGKLSASKIDGRYYIDKAELFRVFPKEHKIIEEKDPDKIELKTAKIEMENEFLRTMLENKEKENEFLKNQIEKHDVKEKQMMEAITHHTRLLEHHSTKVESEENSWLGIFKRKGK